MVSRTVWAVVFVCTVLLIVLLWLKDDTTQIEPILSPEGSKIAGKVFLLIAPFFFYFIFRLRTYHYEYFRNPEDKWIDDYRAYDRLEKAGSIKGKYSVIRNNKVTVFFAAIGYLVWAIGVIGGFIV